MAEILPTWHQIKGWVFLTNGVIKCTNDCKMNHKKMMFARPSGL